METVSDLHVLQEHIDQRTTFLLVLWREDDPDIARYLSRLDRLVRRYPPLRSFSVCLDTHPTAAARFGAFRPPSVVIYTQGRMVFKVSDSYESTPVKEKLDAIYAS
ncbi:MAG: hypothetical protein ACLFNQ_05045 [Spirochaetaceae bacterium]